MELNQEELKSAKRQREEMVELQNNMKIYHESKFLICQSNKRIKNMYNRIS